MNAMRRNIAKNMPWAIIDQIEVTVEPMIEAIYEPYLYVEDCNDHQSGWGWIDADSLNAPTAGYDCKFPILAIRTSDSRFQFVLDPEDITLKFRGEERNRWSPWSTVY